MSGRTPEVPDILLPDIRGLLTQSPHSSCFFYRHSDPVYKTRLTVPRLEATQEHLRAILNGFLALENGLRTKRDLHKILLTAMAQVLPSLVKGLSGPYVKLRFQIANSNRSSHRRNHGKTPWVDSTCADCPGFLVLGAAPAPASTFVSEPQIVRLA